MPTMLQLLRLHFDEAMAPARVLGWWVAFDYQPAGHSSIYANRIGFHNREYTELTFRDATPVEVYQRWFANCAGHLERAVNLSSVTFEVVGQMRTE